MRYFVLPLALVLLFPALTFAQLHNPENIYSVPQDEQSFFFQPSEFSPNEVGVFKDVMNSFSLHPLSSINRNPANLKQLSGNSYLYLDVRTLPQIEQQQIDCSDCGNFPQPSPGIINDQVERSSQEPLFSSALFISPFKSTRLTFGFTYQLLNVNEQYYQLPPQSFGNGGWPSINATFIPTPSEEFIGSVSEMKKNAHFPAILIGYEFSHRLSAGFKLSYNNYTANGRQISEYFARQNQDVGVQTNDFSRQRLVEYDHWDYSIGMKYALTNSMEAGISAGFLSGTFDQGGQEQFLQSMLNEGEGYYYKADNNYLQRNGFIRDGKAIYMNAEYSVALQKHFTLLFTYRGSRATQDVNYGSTSFSTSHMVNTSTDFQGQEITSIIENRSYELNEGAGDATNWRHQVSANVTRDFSNGFQLRTGIQLNLLTNNESVFESSHNLYFTERNDYGSEFSMSTSQEFSGENEIHQDFSQVSAYLPLILKKSFNNIFAAELGTLGHFRNNVYKLSGEIRSNFLSLIEVRNQDSYKRFNAYGAVIYSPSNQLTFRFTGFSDRRDLSPVNKIESFRFQVGAEIKF